MKVLVPVKRVIDAYAKVRVKSDESGVDTQNIKMSMNPFDEIAVEAAVQLKEKGIVSEIVAVSIGPAACQETLRTALALGCDEARLIEHDADLEPFIIAKLLQQVVSNEQADCVIMGKQSIDGDNNQTGQMLAALLNWPQATFSSELSFQDGTVEATREIDGGLETIAVKQPCVITTDLRLNEPRYASLPNIMKAKKKPLSTQAASELGVSLEGKISTIKVSAPTQRQAGVTVDSVEELVEKLRNEAKVI